VLTSEGQEKCRKTASALAHLDVTFDLILASPFLRARETAEIVVAGLNLEKSLEISQALRSGGPAGEVIDELQKRARKFARILIAGHEPDLSQLISIFLAGDLSVSVKMKKGSLAKICFPHLPAPGEGTLEWLLAPKQLVALGSRN
jgi:phosphohistidine phosphatase